MEKKEASVKPIKVYTNTHLLRSTYDPYANSGADKTTTK
jgi:hypothetical protein